MEPSLHLALYTKTPARRVRVTIGRALRRLANRIDPLDFVSGTITWGPLEGSPEWPTVVVLGNRFAENDPNPEGFTPAGHTDTEGIK